MKNRHHCRVILYCVSAWMFFMASVLAGATHAQITLDGSLGPASALTGPNFVIPASVGQTRGGNLFHSFGLFNIQQGESATFTGSSSIHDIIGRVTGGQQSVINGKLASTIDGANLFLINPAGVLFGPYVSLDVKGSFHVSTADYLKFADGAKFYADLNKQSTLTTAAISAFGFLTQHPGGIMIDQSRDDISIPIRPRFQVQSEQTISLIGGDIDVVGSPRTAFGKDTEPTIYAPSGGINIISVASPGEVTLNTPEQPGNTILNGFTRMGNVTLSNDALISTSTDPNTGKGNGTILVRGNNLVITNNSYLFADTKGDVNGSPIGIDVNLTGTLALSNGGRITSDRDLPKDDGTGRMGSAGDIVINANQVELTGVGSEGFASIIASRLFPGTSGDGANIQITANRVSVNNGARISTETAGNGTPGSINIITNKVDLSSGGSITSSALRFGTGGDIKLSTNELTLSDASSISAMSSGTGDAGNISASVSGSLWLSNSKISTQAVSGNGGNIHLTAGELVDLTRSQITTSVQNGKGKGGNITVDPTFVILNKSNITANAFGGPGGNVSIVADVFLASSDSSVTASSVLSTPGTIDIQAPITDLIGSLAPLPETIVQATSLLPQSCAARFSSGKLSSLAVTGRTGLPWEPGLQIPSFLYRPQVGSGSSGIHQSNLSAEQKLTTSYLAYASLGFSDRWTCVGARSN